MSVFGFVEETELDKAEEELNELNAQRQTLEDLIGPAIERIKNINEEIKRIRAEAEAAMNKLATERSELEVSIWEDRKKLKAVDREILAVEKRIRLLQEKEKRKKEYQDATIQFDKVTYGLQWREFALEHQIEGARMMASAGKAILADKMGLGKTLTVLAAADMVRSQRVLIVAPADVVKNFEQEVRHWAPHRQDILAIYRMTALERNAAFTLLSAVPDTSFVILINYEAWRKDQSVIDKLVELRFDTVILDEAHNIKEVNTSAYKGVEKLVFAENVCPVCGSPSLHYKTVNKMSHHRCTNNACSWNTEDFAAWEPADRRSVKHVWPMTGTAILNRPDELYPLLHLILPDVFTHVEVFRNVYCKQDINTGKWEFRPGGLSDLSSHLQGRYIARNREDAGVILPKQEIRVVEIPLSEMEEDYPNQYRIFKQLSQHAQIILESGTVTAIAAITMILRKRQVNVYPGGIQLKDADGNVVYISDEVTESIKIDRALRILQEVTSDGLESGERAVLFSQFKAPLQELKRRLDAIGIRSVIFDGNTPEAVREEIKTDFNRSIKSERKWQVVLANYKVGGVGLTMTEATHVVVLDEEWNPGKNEQAWARVDRVGQTEETTVHILRIGGTIDTWMAKLIEHKGKIVSGLDAVASDLLEAMQNGEI